MLMVQAILISILMIQINLTNSQSVITNCSFSDDCVSPLTSSFTQDCSAGRLKQYARCLSNQSCLNPETAGTQLNEHYCDSEEYECSISCIEGEPLACTLMCSSTEDTKRQAIFECTKCFDFRFHFGGSSSARALIGVIITTALVAITFPL